MLKKYLDGEDVLALIVAVGVAAPSPHNSRIVGQLRLIADDAGSWLAIKSGEAMLSFCVAGCFVEYGDTREAPPAIKESAERRFEGVLSIVNPQLKVAMHIFEQKKS